MLLIPNSEVIIGSFRFKRLNEVRIKRSLHSYVNTATIKIPSLCRVREKDGTRSELVNTGLQFKDGDEVTINIGVNGGINEEFRGFVVRRNLNMPLEVECEGFSYLMRRDNSVTKVWKKAKVSVILKDAFGSLPITVKVDTNSDIELLNVSANGATAADVLDLIIKESKGALNAFFIEHDVLWVGLAYVPDGELMKDVLGKPQVSYRLGYNVIKDNSLKQRIPSDCKVIIHTKASKRQRGGASETAGRVKKLLSNHLDASDLSKLKDVMVKKETYEGYEGKINAFLIPYCEPGYSAFITDSRYKERDGTYLIESTEVSFGVNGYRRTVEIGPQISA